MVSAEADLRSPPADAIGGFALNQHMLLSVKSLHVSYGAIKALHSRIAADSSEVALLKAENAELKAYLCSKDPAAPFCKQR